MNKLQEKHNRVLMENLAISDNGIKPMEKVLQQSVEISLEFAKGFAEWINTYYFQTFGGSWGVKGTDGELYSTDELLNKYLETCAQ